jgi:hypothetical protein
MFTIPLQRKYYPYKKWHNNFIQVFKNEAALYDK